jgi:predicted TIM-barrel fold metal-dependent hydrolase
MRENPSRPPPGTGSVEHLRRDMQQVGVGRAVLVQTGSVYWWDNRLMAETARANRHDMVGVCNLNPAASESVEELERLASEYNVHGLRLEAISGPGPQYYHPGSVRLFETARRMGLVICAHTSLQCASELARLLLEFPDVPVVFDHSGYLQAADAPESARLQTVIDLARFKNLFTKLTFGVTGSAEAYPFRDIHPVIRQVITAFGPDRCMWGSDFPCEHWLKKATYAQHLALFTEELGLSRAEQTAILSETPLRLWFG